MNDEYAHRLAADTVRIERLLPGPIERVWAYLTDADKRGLWLAAGEMEPRVGGALSLRFRHAQLSSEVAPVPERYRDLHENGHVSHERVTVCEPPRRLAYTWGGGGSEVSFDLSPHGEQVRLVLIHRRLADAEMSQVAGGWHTHLGVLQDCLAGRRPKNFWTVFVRIEAEYAQRLSSASADRAKQ
jgi:uncharacterized protein YndB with AHSA1/START domain